MSLQFSQVFLRGGFLFSTAIFQKKSLVGRQGEAKCWGPSFACLPLALGKGLGSNLIALGKGLKSKWEHLFLGQP